MPLRPATGWLLILAVLCGFPACQTPRADDAPTTALLPQYPAGTAAQAESLAVEVLQRGPSGLRTLCSLLVPPGQGDDLKVRFAIDGVVTAVTRDRADPRCKTVAGALLASLSAHPAPEVRRFLLLQIQRTAAPEAVAPLAALLPDPEVGGDAVRALTAIGTPSAGRALVQALPGLPEERRGAVIEALGKLRHAPAAPLLLPYARGTTPLRPSALRALAEMGEPAEGRLYDQACQNGTPVQRAFGAECYLLYARRIAAQGRRSEALLICRGLLLSRTEAREIPSACAALDTLSDLAGKDAFTELTAAVEGPHPALRQTALAIAARQGGRNGLGTPSGEGIAPIPGGSDGRTAEWAALCNRSRPEVRCGLLDLLGRRGDAAALPAIEGALESASVEVRNEAAQALARLGKETALPLLFKQMNRSESREEAQALQTVLEQLIGKPQLPRIEQAFPEANTAARVVLLDLLRTRQGEAQAPLVLTAARDQAPEVRLAALKTLAAVARPTDLAALIGLGEGTQGQAEADALRDALAAAARKSTDESSRADPLVDAFEKAKPAARGTLLQALGRVGGAKSLVLVRQQQESADPALKEAAFRALVDWPDASAAPDLLRIAGAANEAKERTLALRGFVRLVQSRPGTAPEVRAGEYAQGLPLARTKEEKQPFLAALAEAPCESAFDQVLPLLDDPDLGEEAAAAALRLSPAMETNVGKCRTGLEKALKVSKDENRRKQIQERLDQLPHNAAPPESAAAPASGDGTTAPPAGFIALFNGRDLAGWKGVLGAPLDNPLERGKLSPAALAEAQAQADALMREHWKAESGVLRYDGKGFSLSTARDYDDFELLVDWMIQKGGDSGIYLRGAPQVQIWDETDPAKNAKAGSGALYNNEKNPSKPLKIADRPAGQWNTFRIRMEGERATVHLNGVLVADQVAMENYWDRGQAIFPAGPIELQHHGSPLAFRNLFIREIPRERADGWQPLFNGRDLAGWTGNTQGYQAADGVLEWQSGGNLFTEKEYADFHFRFEFKLTPGANNGLGIRAPLEGDAAYAGMELQILDDTAEVYKNLQPYQYHGSIYGVAPARRGFLKPVGEWNAQEVIAEGPNIRVILNGTTIVDARIDPQAATMDHQSHPGLKRTSGHIGFLGHSDKVYFRKIDIRELP